MREGLALLLVNMLASEFGYKFEWLTDPAERDAAVFRLVNPGHDSREFSGQDKFEQAVAWLREKA
ncbi:MAG TPA: hypothetical protein VL485_15580 [Ktedonobacteraceae bacterium]|jgi:hypothetical protein|nr:hypothetical protein [Ktedonobacteraceae bacterium]